MRRRQVLAALGSAAALAGCADAPAGDATTGARPAGTSSTPSSATRPPTTKSESTTESTTAEDATAETTTEPPPQVGRPAPVEGCPTYDGDVTRVACNPIGESSDTDLVMEPDASTIALPRDGVSFTLTNHADATFDTNFLSWRIHKRVDGDWYRVAPWTWGIPSHRLSAGDSHTWQITVDNTDLNRYLPMPGGRDVATVAGLGGGEYAFGLDGWFRSHERTTAVVARFRVEGGRVELVPTGSVEVTAVAGDTLEAVEPVPDDDGPIVTLTATQVAASDAPAGEVRTLVTEQLLRRTITRNAVALLRSRDVRSVRLESPQRLRPAYDLDGPTFLRYDGTVYRLEAEREIPE